MAIGLARINRVQRTAKNYSCGSELLAFSDIEIKTTDLLAVAGYGSCWTNVVEEYSKLLKDTRSAYFINVATADLAEAECAAGYTFLQGRVDTFCLNMLCIPDIGWIAISGCRAKMFSIHAVC
jgi:hypothetical protein